MVPILLLMLILFSPATLSKVMDQSAETVNIEQSNFKKNTINSKREETDNNPIPPRLSPTQAPTRNPSATTDTEKESEGLTAHNHEEKTKSSNWVSGSDILDSLELLVSIIVAFFLFRTFRLTQRSTQAALQMAQQNRAWVVLGEKRTETIDPHLIDTEIPLTIINTGGTPALNVKVEYRIESYPTDEIGDNIPIIISRDDFQMIGTLGPSITYPGTILLTSKAKQALESNSRRLFIYTNIQYKTIYGGIEECVTVSVEEVVSLSSQNVLRQYGIFNVGEQHSAS